MGYELQNYICIQVNIRQYLMPKYLQFIPKMLKFVISFISFLIRCIASLAKSFL